MLAHMGVCVSVLASGSRGNSALLESSRARILVDAGVSCRETFKRLKLVGREPRSLSAILITHEHSDHVSAGRQFQIADITVMPFTIPHDAADPVGFTFHAEGAKIAFATDLGYMPASVRDHLRRCDVLILESNHDVEMLRVGPYPWSVKQRVMSRVGHLSNDSLAQFFAEDYDGGASHIVLAHLSEQNNHPEVARRTAEQALGPQQTLLQNRLMLALQDAPTEAIRL